MTVGSVQGQLRGSLCVGLCLHCSMSESAQTLSLFVRGDSEKCLQQHLPFHETDRPVPQKWPL